MFKSNKAFTLLEVLITLAIIGIVSVIVMSVLTTQIFLRDRAVRIKKAYSVLSTAYRYIIPIKGHVIDWSNLSAKTVGEYFAQNMYKADSCDTQILEPNNHCVPECPEIYKANGETLNTCESEEVSKLKAADGFSYAFQIEDPSCRTSVLSEDSTDKDSVLRNICGTAMVDIYAGSKGTNLYGADLYLFYITKDGIYPVGMISDAQYPLDEELCRKRATEDVVGCTAKLIYDDNVTTDDKVVQ